MSVPVDEGARIRGSIVIDCSNHPGPTITLSGGPALDAIGIKAIFWLQFLNGAGQPRTSKVFRGRCVQGSKN